MLSSCITNPPIVKEDHTYKGKFSFSTTETSSAFNAQITEQHKKLIIQVSRPFFGNVANLSIYQSGRIESSRQLTIDLELSALESRKLYSWFKGCLQKENIDKNGKYLFLKENTYRLVCNSTQSKIFFELKSSIFELSGFVFKND
jgi:hypothetical protein